MMCKSATASLFILFSFTLCASAQTTYRIKIKEFPDEGKEATETAIEKATATIKEIVKGEVKKEETKTQGKELVFTIRTLTKGGDRPKKFQKTFTKAVQTADKSEKTLPYQGRTIFYELKGNKYELKAEGEPALAAAILNELQKTTDLVGQAAKVLPPAKEVEVGDTWKIDPAKLGDLLDKSAPIDAAKSTGQGKLVKVYEKDNRQFAVLEFDFKLALTSFLGLKLKTPHPFDLKFRLDTAIDGSTTQRSSSSGGTLLAKIETMKMGQAVTLDINFQLSGSQELSEEK